MPVAEGHELCDRCRTDRVPAGLAERVAGEADGRPGPAPIELRAGFVGRRDALRRVQYLFEGCRDSGRLCFVTIVGQAGVGKSRFGEEIIAAIAAACPDVRALRGAAASDMAPPYLAIARMLETRFGIVEEDRPSVARDKILAGASERLPAPRATEVAHLLGQLMRFPFPESPYVEPLADSPAQLEMRMYIALRRLLQADAEARPLVLIADELDRAPTETIKVLHYLADGLTARPVLIVALGRPELLAARPSFGEGDWEHAHIELPPLDREEAESLVSDLVWRAPLPPALRETVLDRLGGNPRAIEELLRYLVEVEVAHPTAAGPFTFDREALESTPLPATYEEILWARLRALPPAERELLEKAAVVGECFWLDAIVALSRAETAERGDPDGPAIVEIAAAGDRSRVAVAQGLARLAARGLLRERHISQIAGEHEYRFVGPVAALAYDAIPAPTRRRYHRIVAQWLDLRPGRGEEGQEQVARHLERAGDERLAAARLRRAAEAARGRYFNDQAQRLFREALRCAKSDGALRIELWHDLGSVYDLVGDYEKALDAFERVLRLSWVFASRAKGGVALNKMGRIWRRKGDLSMALEYLDRGLDLFRQNGDERGVASSLDDIGYVLWLQGRYEDALDRATRSLSMRRELGDARSIALSLTNIGNIQKDRGLLAEAQECHEEALEIRREIDDRAGVPLSLNYLGVLQQERGELGEAFALLEDALREAEAIGAQPLQALLLTNLGDLAVQRGATAEARQRLEQALALGRDLGSRRILSAAHRSMGLLELKEGRLARARESCEAALRIAEVGGIREFVGRALLALGEVEAATLFDAAGGGEDHARLAQGYMSRAVDLFREIRNDAELGRALERLGRLKVERGASAEGKALLGEAQAIFDRLGVRGGEEVRGLLREIASGG
ncbi:MAG: tetratricopeptide repeat protein [Myxococcota bacterium]